MQVTRLTHHISSLALVLIALPLGAQSQAKEEKYGDIPKSAWPAPGQCRVWLKDVTPSQQPAATDCASAVRSMPNTAKVLFGDMPGVSAPARSSTREPAPNPYSVTRGRLDDPIRSGIPQKFSGQTQPMGSATTPTQQPVSSVISVPTRSASATAGKPEGTPPPAGGKPEMRQ